MHSPGATAFGNDFIYVFNQRPASMTCKGFLDPSLQHSHSKERGILECSCLQGYHLPHFLTFPWSLYL
ncbi:Hypothetical protein FKW44_022578 [Caligus rogercresseyi]|uniref:Uncharacterized protein n=1 Tax=Caligus rogercresseyi TaxID=217165 RepID=A0A7T8JTM2_CALRO|nr:Hypothetical protein FKW44_022578 [Caligus rogercresseyi]